MIASVSQFLDRVPLGILGTQRADGSIRQSAVYFAAGDGAVYVSTERDRHKARDVSRTGRASLCVVGPAPPFPSVTVDGPARIITTGLGPVTGRIFARMTGGDAPALTDDDLRALGRVIIRIDIERVYGVSYLPDTGEQTSDH
jgi:PPOX class probable F420-dependent enzyme